MIHYPAALEIIFTKLKRKNIRAIIVGGYIRDSLLHRASKDIDIELYCIDSFKALEDILQEFGSLNSVGKSFGVCKLNYRGVDLDFSLPRSDSKIDEGHRGFEVKIDCSLDFKSATSRRDFTINAIGYDLLERKILDPYHGREDLKKHILRAVDLCKFAQDPLRVLRAVQMSARFDLKIEPKLFQKCKEMIATNLLDELPKERIFEEIQKLLLKAKKPSEGFLILRALGDREYTKELYCLNEQEYNRSLNSLDTLSSAPSLDKKKRVIIMLALLSSYLTQEQAMKFISRLTLEKELLKSTIALLKSARAFNLDNYDNFAIYTLARSFVIEDIALYFHAFYLGERRKDIELFLQKAKELNVLKTPLAPIIQGRDLISLGLQPSKIFSYILESSYIAQMQELFSTKQEALLWVSKNHLSLS